LATPVARLQHIIGPSQTRARAKNMFALREGTVASPGARLTYLEVHAMGPAQEPLNEFKQPVIDVGEANKEVWVKAYDEEDEPEKQKVYLVKTEDPDSAYNLIGKPSIMLDHHSEGWGQIDVAVVLTRDRSQAANNGMHKFIAPAPEAARLVAIKKLNKEVIRQYLEKGGHEDPYKEVSRMQELGDGVHVLECLEALEDEDYLYIVSPYTSEGSLADRIDPGNGYPEAEAQALFRNILEILLYLERHGIFHHDLSPDNFLFFKGRLILFDLAMSMRVPRLPNGNRFLITPQGVYGTPPCLAPEIFLNRTPFDGVACDLWGAATILYILLTGHPLYKLPHPTDRLFRYYILAGGLAPVPNEQVVEMWQNAVNAQDNRTLAAFQANLNIPPDARELLINLLRLRPGERWTLQQAVDSTWVQSNMRRRQSAS